MLMFLSYIALLFNEAIFSNLGWPPYAMLEPE